MTRNEAREWFEDALNNNDFFPETKDAFKVAIEALKDEHYVVRESWVYGNRGEAIEKLDELRDEVYNEDSDGHTYAKAIDMAIESLRADTVSRSQYQGLLNAIGKVYVEVVRCEVCKHQDHCHETVAHTKKHDGFIERWSEPIEWCSKGERRE